MPLGPEGHARRGDGGDADSGRVVPCDGRGLDRGRRLFGIVDEPSRRFQAIPGMLDQAEREDRIRAAVREDLERWYEAVADELETMRRHGTESGKVSIGRLARLCTRAVEQIAADEHDPHPLCTALAEECLATLGVGPDPAVLVFPGLAAFPTAYVLRYRESPTLLVFDGQDPGIACDHHCALVSHEASHAHPTVQEHARSLNARRSKVGEAMGDILGLALTGAAFPAALVEFQQRAGIPPARCLPQHPSFAARCSILETEAEDLWEPPYLDEVREAAERLSGELRDAEADLCTRAHRAVERLGADGRNIKVEAQDIYDARRAKGGDPSPRVRVAAAFGERRPDDGA